MKRRALGYLALLLLAPQLARGARIVAVRVWPAKDYTRVTIESDALIETTQQVLANPPRLVVDIKGLELDAQLRELVGKIKPDDPYIAQLRVGSFAAGATRLVLDLKTEVKPQVFNLAPVAAYAHRLVFDLFPAKPTDPLEALLADLAKNPAPPERVAPAAAAASASTPARPQAPVTDPLTEFLNRQLATPRPAPAPQPAPQPAPPSPTSVPTATAPPAPAPSQITGRRPIIVALDAGHGGEDPGAIGPAGTREKDVVLSIARMVKERLDAEPRLRAVLTRDADFFVPLAERVKKAQRVRADLFVSIHADAFIQPRARGASVFALSQKGASSAQARWLANKENAADAVGGINVNSADREVMRALLDLSTAAQIKDSLVLGKHLLREIGSFQHLHKAHVEQAGFAVLKSPDIPSILVETAFISNPEEEQKLASREHQEKLADAITNGIKRYFAANPALTRGG